MDPTGAVGTVVAVIAFFYFLYDRYVKRRHLVHINLGNVMIVRMASKDETKDGNLFALIHEFEVVNSGSMPITFKALSLTWTAGSRKDQCEPIDLSVGSAGPGNTIGLANAQGNR